MMLPRLLLGAAFSLLLGGVAAAQPAATGAGGKTAVATFAGGCFWCVESDFDKIDGVLSTTSSYTGGKTANPTYKQVSAGGTGHTEAVEIVYDPAKVSYERLLEVFWANHDPLTPNRQFCDVGNQYRAGIFYHDEEQKRLAEASKAKVIASRRFKQPVVTEITAASQFYKAEDYHQDYYKRNSLQYNFYRWNCGRDRRLKQLWGDKATVG